MQAQEVILITGAARRVGAALARRLARAGYSLVRHCREARRSEASALAEELGGEACARIVSGELAERGCAARLFAAAENAFGAPVGILVNNASVYHRRNLLDASEEELLTDFQVNFLAPFALMREFAKRGRGGHIINLLDARIGKCDADSMGYTIAKEALASATRTCALAWAAQGIRVNGIAPGFVLPPDGVPAERMQPLLQRLPLRRRTTEEEVADALLFLLQCPSVTGEILYLDSGLHLPTYPVPEKKGG